MKTEKVDRFPGSVCEYPESETKRPAIIVLGGSETVVGWHANLRRCSASRSFAVLGLPYYSPVQFPATNQRFPRLPASFADIPVERLNDAYGGSDQARS